MRVDVDPVSGELVGHFGTVGHDKRRRKALRAGRPHNDASSDLFPCERSVAAHADPDRAGKRAKGK